MGACSQTVTWLYMFPLRRFGWVLVWVSRPPPLAGAPSAATFEASAVLPSLLCFRGLSLPSFVLIMWSFSLSA